MIIGYMTEFSCLYIAQRHYFISTLWLWRTDEYVFIYILSESSSLTKDYNSELEPEMMVLISGRSYF